MKIIWAVDPFAANDVPLAAMAAYFQALGGEKTVILPVYVASPAESQLSLAFDVPEKQRFTTYPKNLLARALADRKLGIPERRIRVLAEPSASMKAASDRLIAYATEVQADLIAVFSHSNKGLKRVVMGSFAETLVHRSPTSVLVFNPTCRVPERIESILFATDLSAREAKGLHDMLRVLPAGGVRVTLFHAIPRRMPPSELAPMYLVKGMTDSDKERTWGPTVRALDNLSEFAAEHGFKAEVRFEESEERTAALILKHAKQSKAGLVVVTAHAGPVRALFLGSVTRELLRRSSLPVWVVRS